MRKEPTGDSFTAFVQKGYTGQVGKTDALEPTGTDVSKANEQVAVSSQNAQFSPEGPALQGAPYDDDKVANNLEGAGNLITEIDDKVKIIAKDTSLSDWIQESFTDRAYRTVETTKDIIAYRGFGGTANAKGAFVTTLKITDKEEMMDKLALLPEWRNTLESMATIKIPKGTTINIGKVAEQVSETGQVFKGGADQILMPENWSDEWIIDISTMN